MIGELYALLAALAYGAAGVAIQRGRATARGDNGVFLSVLVTAALTFSIWALWGRVPLDALLAPDTAPAIGLFVAAGLLSTVLGRTWMFRATERTGPVTASLLRRLTPVFGLPLAFVMLSELPDGATLAGAALVLAGVMIYLPPRALRTGTLSRIGLAFGVGSAGAYALAYTLRSAALEPLPDAALGTCIGALAGLVWIVATASLRRGRKGRLTALVVDHGPWHLLAALALSLGQFLQFLALQTTTVVSVATLGTLEVVFAALLLAALTGQRPAQLPRLIGAGAVALAGTALMLR
ncbi:DMT family transporter [Thalassorhabdomicrobium marinisediminis]|uniref:EamA family transporter n=1 Tax=Thalassorhabdomicrobium marinisediminis TaxID=2170577 RepID=A0A2T7FTG2_9RHOB|nr:DMT family transporter [Thalassorhabdomicrobium marinisediminis]PVA05461.1 EamA family transporter [Thalassorhabdomicrobium marinisediminis]